MLATTQQERRWDRRAVALCRESRRLLESLTAFSIYLCIFPQNVWVAALIPDERAHLKTFLIEIFRAWAGEAVERVDSESVRWSCSIS